MKTIFLQDMIAVLTSDQALAPSSQEGAIQALSIMSASIDREISGKITREWRIYLPIDFYTSDILSLGRIIKKETLIDSCSLETGLPRKYTTQFYDRINEFLKKQFTLFGHTVHEICVEGFGTFSKSLDGVFYEARTFQSFKDHPYLKG